MTNILITERQLELITKNQASKNVVSVNESEWYNTVGDIAGIFDPTPTIDIINGISYFSQGDTLFGILSIISAVPYVGDIVSKPVVGALKIGGTATKELKIAMDLAKAGKTAEASVSLAKLAKEPGVVGKFLQSAKSWSPKVASYVEKLPGGLLKGFKNTILDYLKLLENAGAKSVKFQKAAGNLAKYIGNAAKPAENIAALKNLLKTEKVFTGLTKKGPLANIFLGGAPRLFGDKRMRILMRQTKWWLGFLDYIGVANFVGPDELTSKMSESDIKQKMEKYNQTTEAKSYAKEDFGDAQEINQDEINDFIAKRRSGQSTQTTTSQSSNNDGGVLDFMGKIFGGNLKNAAFLI